MEEIELQSFPFNSILDDREYEASVFRNYFAKFLSTGVYFGLYNDYGDYSMKVVPSAGLNIRIIKGCGLIKGVDFNLENDTELSLEMPVGANRKDMVVVRLDDTLESRKTTIYIKQGTDEEFAELERTTDVYELCLAKITVADRTLEIIVDDIEDTRRNSELCGIVTSLIDIDIQDVLDDIIIKKEQFFSNLDNIAREEADELISLLRQYCDSKKDIADGLIQELQDMLQELSEDRIPANLVTVDNEAFTSNVLSDVLNEFINKLNEKSISKTFTVTFITQPENSTIIVKDENQNIVQPTVPKIYKLKMGTYTYSVSCAGYFTKENQSLGVLEDQVVNVSLDKKLYVEFLVTPSDAEVVVKNGDSEILTPESANTYAVRAGTYSYSVTKEGYRSVENVSFSITDAEESKQINVVLQDASIYGVRRLISSTATAWERLAAGDGMVANATKDGGTVRNDFDNVSPWKDIKTCDLAANGTVNKYIGDAGFSLTNPSGYIMTEVPEFWYQRKQENGYEYIYISSVEQDGFTKSNKFYIGRYDAGGTSSALNSKSGVAPITSISITDFRTAAKRIGSNWGQLDILRWSVLQMLYLVEYADYNSQNMLGYGICSGSKTNSGGCDTLGMKSGCTGNDKKKPVIYRGIENIFGNVFQWCDGVNFTSSTPWVSYNPENYVSDKFEAPYTRLGYNAVGGGYIKTVGYDSNYSAIQLPSAVGGSDSTYIPDYALSYSGSRVLYVGGGYDDGLVCGLWYASWGINSSYTYSNLGGRLLFVPV